MAIAEVELNTISKSIKSAMGETAGQFRQAAAASSANLNKIIKDLANSISAQRRDTAELNNSIEESIHESQQTSSKIDHLMSAFQESITIQTQMLGQLSNMGRNISILNDSTENFNRSVSSMLTGQNGIGNLLSTGFGNMTTAVQNIGAFAVGAGATMVGANMVSGGLGSMKGVGESGSSSEAMSFFQSKGWTKEQSAGIVGNLQVESGKNLRTDAVGDSGQAYGVAQWHPDRQAKFQQVMGIPIRQSNFKQQLEFVQWELMNSEKRAGQMLKAASTAIEAARAIDYGYERSSHQHLGQRMANAVALAKETSNSGSTATPSSQTPSATSVATSTQKPEVFQQGPVASDTAPRTDPGLTPHHIGGGHGDEGHGQGKLSGVNKSILDKFDQIKSMVGTPLTVTSGFRDPAHNAAVGGAKNSAHTRGNAVDVTFSGGIPETLKLIEAASKAGIGGIGVYRPGVLHFDTEAKRAWGPSYHSDSIPDWARGAISKHLGGGVGGKTPDAEPSATTPSTASQMQQMQSAESSGVLGTGKTAATPVEQPNISQSMSPVSAPVSSAEMLGMMSMMGAVPGLGGISGILPIAASVVGMLESLSSTMSNVDIVNQTAVAKQAQSESLEETLFGGKEPQNDTAIGSGTNISMSSTGESYAYNHPEDTGWPDWASMIGGNHWEEMKNFKKNMWG